MGIHIAFSKLVTPFIFSLFTDSNAKGDGIISHEKGDDMMIFAR